MSEETKYCTRCKDIKPVSGFSDRPYPSGFVGKYSQCMNCRTQASALWAKKPDGKAALKKWKAENYKRNRDKILFAQRHKWKENRQKWRHGNFMKKYGLSAAEVDAMKVAQQFKCAVCKSDMRPLNLDHDHRTGKIREMLCSPCNRGLGHFGDSPQLLSEAIKYLIRHSGNSGTKIVVAE